MEYEKLKKAVWDLYYAAYWSPDRPCDAKHLWEEVRNAAGLEPGMSTKILGERNV